MKIKDIMTKEVRSLKSDMTLIDAARLMRELDVGGVPVVKNSGELEGIITDRDIIIRSIALGKDPGRTNIDSVMTKDIVTITPDTDIDDAARIMSAEKIRRLPVVDGVRLIGMVSLGDFAVKDNSDIIAGEVLEDVSTPIGPKA